jgi:hypothetical protein
MLKNIVETEGPQMTLQYGALFPPPPDVRDSERGENYGQNLIVNASSCVRSSICGILM